MIVRIMGEGQFRIDDSDRDNLNELDNAAVAAAEGGDEATFLKTFAEAKHEFTGEGLIPD